MIRTELLNDITSRAAHVMPLSPAAQLTSVDGSVQEKFNSARQSLREAYPFLWSGSEELASDEREKYDGLFAWLAKALAEYTGVDTSPQLCLPQLLALASLLECKGQLWHELAQVVQIVPVPLIADIGGIIRTCRANGTEILARSRYGTNFIPRTLDDVAAKNWKSLQWVVEHCWHDFWMPLKQQAYAAMYHLNRVSLQAIFECENDFFEVTTYVLHAPIAESLQLATASSNWTLKFWAAFHSARHAAAGEIGYPSAWKILLSEAAQLPREWASWLAVFNEYPNRYPQLQHALGEILPSMSSKALDVYIESLAHSEMNREQVATTLKYFSESASITQRQHVWTSAYKRWQQWDFGSTEQSEYVGDVKRSVFDFPLIGYMTECLDASARAEWREQLRLRAEVIDSDWYADITKPISERFKLISTYQLLAHAENVASGAKNWLAELPLYRPSWEDGSLFRAIKYDQPFGPPTFLDQSKT